MSDDEQTTDEEATRPDAPNQQLVRPDGSGPADEGEGGSGSEEARDRPSDLDEMTKAELLEYARELGVSPANNDMTKDELRAGIDAQQQANG